MPPTIPIKDSASVLIKLIFSSGSVWEGLGMVVVGVTLVGVVESGSLFNQLIGNFLSKRVDVLASGFCKDSFWTSADGGVESLSVAFESGFPISSTNGSGNGFCRPGCKVFSASSGIVLAGGEVESVLVAFE